RPASAGTTGCSAFSASIARRAWSSSFASSLPYASDASSEHVCTRNSSTFALRNSSTSSSAPGVNSASDTLACPDLLDEDVLERRAFLVARDLPLRGVAVGDREPLRSAELLRNRLHPLDELLEARPRGHRLAALEVEQFAGEPVADRTPEVLLEQPR